MVAINLVNAKVCAVSNVCDRQSLGTANVVDVCRLGSIGQTNRNRACAAGQVDDFNVIQTQRRNRCCDDRVQRIGASQTINAIECVQRVYTANQRRIVGVVVDCTEIGRNGINASSE